jgi:ribonuclease BN (tRNA processing enzyme)
MSIELVFLGTGTSVGVPMIGCRCPVCTSQDPRNTRRRTSLYVQTEKTAVVLDTPPDFRQQALDYGVERVDAVVFTHAHADHIFRVRRHPTLQHDPRLRDSRLRRRRDTGRCEARVNYIGNTPSPQGLYRPRSISLRSSGRLRWVICG